MLFNSLDFAIFLPIVFILYWFVVEKHLKAQNALIAIASYVFYGWWDWRFLSLIVFSSVIDYFYWSKVGKNRMGAEKKNTFMDQRICESRLFRGFQVL
jgi:D-alanyl-lipoteichoic acid acyltransferase DltB (MBOAT superfamily)